MTVVATLKQQRRNALEYLTAACDAALASAAAMADGNLIRNLGLESAEQLDWHPEGEKTLTNRVKTNPHSGRRCLYVKDGGNQWDQENNAHFVAEAGSIM